MTGEKETALVDAMSQLLDDMGKEGRCVCEYAKAKARVAFEPFRDAEDDLEYTVERARKVLEECGYD